MMFQSPVCNEVSMHHYVGIPCPEKPVAGIEEIEQFQILI